jgi:hypothetical protein
VTPRCISNRAEGRHGRERAEIFRMPDIMRSVEFVCTSSCNANGTCRPCAFNYFPQAASSKFISFGDVLVLISFRRRNRILQV